MSSATRLLVLLGCGVLLIASATIAAATWAFHGPGAVAVSVVPRSADGDRVDLRVPAFLVDGAIALIPIGALELDRADPAVRAALPVAAKLLESLEDVPDAVLVEVDDGGDHVLISKEGGRIVIHVDSPDETVDLAVPLGTMRAVASMLTRAARGRG